MVKYKLSQLKDLVRVGAANDITNANSRDVIGESYEKIGCSVGVYGVNGLLLLGDSGKLYAITARSNALFIFF